MLQTRRPAAPVRPDHAPRRRTRPRASSSSFPHSGASPEEREWLEAAVLACEGAAAVCLHVRQSVALDASSVLLKQDDSPVTVADYGAQALVAQRLRRFGLPLVAEESGSELTATPGLLARVAQAVAASGALQPAPSEADLLSALGEGASSWLADISSPPPSRFWVLDPIDGTRGFLAGGEAQYAIGLALQEGAETVVGVMALPNWGARRGGGGGEGLLLASLRGCGAWVRELRAGAVWRRLDCGGGGARPLAFSDLTLCVSDHERCWEETPMGASSSTPSRPARLLPLCCGSLVKYAAVALGEAHAFVQQPVPGKARLKGWDHAAGVAIVREAGGRVLAGDGTPLLLGGFGPEFHPPGSMLLACCAPAAGALCALLPPSVSFQPLRLVLLDRDGTLNVDVGSPGVLRAEQLRLVPGARGAVRELTSLGLTLAVVTNQSCVGKGLLTAEALQALHRRLLSLLETSSSGGGESPIRAVYVCPEAQHENSPRRKPGCAMVLEACARFGVPPSATAFVGDTEADMLAAAAAGVAVRMLLCTGHGVRFGEAARAEGLALPAVVRAGEGALGRMLPVEALPLELHEHVESAARALAGLVRLRSA